MPSQLVQTSLQLRHSAVRKVSETTAHALRPEPAFRDTRLLPAFCVASIDPVPLRLPEALFELGPAGGPCLRNEIAIHTIELGVIAGDCAVETGALIRH